MYHVSPSCVNLPLFWAVPANTSCSTPALAYSYIGIPLTLLSTVCAVAVDQAAEVFTSNLVTCCVCATCVTYLTYVPVLESRFYRRYGCKR